MLTITLPSATVHAISCWANNFSYIIADGLTKQAAVVDGIEPTLINDYIKANSLKLLYVLTTHHHADHSSGNTTWARMHKDAAILGSAYGSTPGATQTVKEGDLFKLGHHTLTPIHTPGHTQDHLTWLLKDSDHRVLAAFTGDFLFQGGCGRLFEGTAPDMVQSIHKLYGQCSLDTLCCCGHEYSLQNLKFAASLPNSNQHVESRLHQLQNLLEGQYSIPSTLKDEADYNPFVRCVLQEGDLQTKCEQFASIRRQKDAFK